MKTVSIVLVALLDTQVAAFAEGSIARKGAGSEGFSRQNGPASVGIGISANASDTLQKGSETSSSRSIGSNMPAPLVLVDAAGKVAGLYLPSTRTVEMRLQNTVIAAAVTNQLEVNTPYSTLGQQSGSTYRWTVQEQTWFLSTDCSGPPIPLATTGLRPVAYTQDLTTGAVTAYIGGTGNSTPRPANSVRQPSLGLGPLSGKCNQQTPFGGVIQGFDVEQTFVLSQRFVEPLTQR